MLIDKDILLAELSKYNTQIEVAKIGDQSIYRPNVIAVQKVIDIVNNQEEIDG